LFWKVANFAEMSEDSQEIEVSQHIEPRNVANYFIFISHDLLEKIPPKRKKRADDILRYAESKFIIWGICPRILQGVAKDFCISTQGRRVGYPRERFLAINSGKLSDFCRLIKMLITHKILKKTRFIRAHPEREIFTW